MPEARVTLKNTETWGIVSRSFHWLIVALLVVQYMLGLFHDSLPRGSMGLHISLGVTILALAVARLAWSLFAGRPAPIASVTPVQRRLALAGHVVLYVLLLAAPITGWLMSNYGDHVVSWFGAFNLPQLVAPNEDAHDLMEGRHNAVVWLLISIAAMHALVAIHHHTFHRDATLMRMWRGK